MWLFELCGGLFTGILFATIGATNRSRKIYREGISRESAKEVRYLMIWILRLQPFGLIVTTMPLLYAFGYVGRFGNWILGLTFSRRISENWSLGVAFVGGAIASGVIGNLSYDVIKYVVKKLYRSS